MQIDFSKTKDTTTKSNAGYAWILCWIYRSAGYSTENTVSAKQATMQKVQTTINSWVQSKGELPREFSYKN